MTNREQFLIGGVGQFVEGLTGFRPANVWFVIEGSFTSLDNARREGARNNKELPRLPGGRLCYVPRQPELRRGDWIPNDTGGREGAAGQGGEGGILPLPEAK